ncbi:MAG: hypothetical protein MRERV_16c012 [Mycoplasmataceae bacterium RV_VA103A]|nr:MAG: hypothetical protein MRERV_16c012 [Mycoplasmataceae bacterium RV_VA103A]
MPEDIKKPTYEELESENKQWQQTVEDLQEVIAKKEQQLGDLPKQNKELQGTVKKLEGETKLLETQIQELKKTSQQPNSEYTFTNAPFDKLANLLEKGREAAKERDQIKKNYEEIKKQLGTALITIQDKQKQIWQLEKLLGSRNSRNKINQKLTKKETRLCEICQQIKTDNFKYSRISGSNYNTYHLYRICSYCQKIVQSRISVE